MNILRSLWVEKRRPKSIGVDVAEDCLPNDREYSRTQRWTPGRFGPGAWRIVQRVCDGQTVFLSF